jgi:hypothetical protein
VPKTPWWRRIFRRRWLLATQLGGVALAILGILLAIVPSLVTWIASTTGGRFALAAICAVTALGSIFTIRDQDTVEEVQERLDAVAADNDFLTAENARLTDDNRALFEDVLKHLAKALDFKYDERITVYEYTEDGFVSIGRYSINQHLRAPGRPCCPVDEGVIGLAWIGKAAFFDDLLDPVADLAGYCADVEARCRVPRETARGFKMKSRTLLGHCILDALGDGPVAVIVLESLQASAFTAEEISRAILREENRLKSYLEQRRAAPTRSRRGRRASG